MDKPWKVILLLVGIFAAGGVAGGFVGREFARKKKDSGQHTPLPVEQWAPEQLRRLVQRLQLTPEQSERLRPILRRDMEDLGRNRGQYLSESRRIIERMEKDIADQLTPEQKAEYEKIKQERAERFRRMTQDRKNRPDGEGRGGPDGPRRRPDRPLGEPGPGGPPPGQKPGEPKPPPGGG